MGAARRTAMRSLVDVILLIVGFVVGGFLAVLLPFLMWPNGITAGWLIVRPDPSADAIRAAELTYGGVLGALGAVVPPIAFRLGYAVGALLAVFVAARSYWSRHDPVAPILMALGAWLVVAGLIELVRRLLASRRRSPR